MIGIDFDEFWGMDAPYGIPPLFEDEVEIFIEEGKDWADKALNPKEEW